MGSIKKFFLFLTMVVFVVDIILVIIYVKSNEEGEPIINVPTYDVLPPLFSEIPTKETSDISIWQPDTPEKGVIINIEYYNQDNFPTFCEGVTTLMSLRYMGYDVTIDDIIAKVPYYEPKIVGGKLYGEDPNLFFVGHPRKSDARGCYAPVIEKLLKEIAGEDAVHNITGMEIEDILTQYINKGIPVIFWATMGMAEPTEGTTWTIERTGETFNWKGREHCLLLAGSDSKSYYFYDPQNNKGIIAYDRATVEKRYEQMGKMAVALVKKGK